MSPALVVIDCGVVAGRAIDVDAAGGGGGDKSSGLFGGIEKWLRWSARNKRDLIG